jgi:methyl-accepting chemotaxis protein
MSEAIERELANVSSVAQGTAKELAELRLLLGKPLLGGAKILDFNTVSRAEANAIKESITETRAQLAGVAKNVQDVAAALHRLTATVELMAFEDDGDGYE